MGSMAGDPTIAGQGSYQQYKNDTAAFLTWLQNAARSCGWKLPKVSGTDATIQLDNNVLPVREILTQAKTVCATTTKSPTVHLPRRIARLAQRAIATRTRFCETFESLTSADASQYQNRSHRHFTSILQEALDMLLEHALEEPSQQKTRVAREIPLPARDTIVMTNAFAGLEVEATVEANDYVQSDRVQKPANENDVLLSTLETAAQVQFAEAGEACMKIMCFFQDMRKLTSQVVALWSEYDEGKREIEPVAMATNAAIALAEQIETDLLTDLFPVGDPVEKSVTTYAGLKSPYAAIVGLLMNAFIGVPGGMPTVWPDHMFDDRGPFFFCDIALTLSKASRALIQRKKQKRTLEDAGRLRHTNKPLFSFFPRVESMEVTLLLYCMDASFLEGPNFEGLDTQDKFLTALLIDYIIRHESLVANEYLPCTRWIDQAMVAFSKLDEGKKHVDALWGSVDFTEPEWDTGKCNTMPTWTEDDIVHHQTLGHLQRIVSDHKSRWAETQIWGLNVLGLNYVELPPRDARWIECLSLLPTISKQESDARMERLAKLKCGGLLIPTTEPKRIFMANPFACGTTMYKMSLAYEQSGICLLNTHLTVFSTMYLYVALKSKGLLRGTWPEMDNLIATHCESLFFGPPPSDLKTLEKVWNTRARLARHITGNWVSVQGGNRTGKKAVKLTGPRCFSISDTAHLFAQCFDGKTDMIRTVHLINELRLKAQSSQKYKTTKQLNFDHPNFLSDYADFIAEDCKRFELNYVPLQRTCNALMVAFVQSELVKVKMDPRRYMGTIPELSNETCDNDNTRMSIFGENGYLLVDSLLVQSSMQDLIGEGWASNKLNKALTKQGADELRERMKRVKTIEAVGDFMQKYLDEHSLLVKPAKPYQASVEEVIDKEFAEHTTTRDQV